MSASRLVFLVQVCTRNDDDMIHEFLSANKLNDDVIRFSQCMPVTMDVATSKSAESVCAETLQLCRGLSEDRLALSGKLSWLLSVQRLDINKSISTAGPCESRQICRGHPSTAREFFYNKCITKMLDLENEDQGHRVQHSQFNGENQSL